MQPNRYPTRINCGFLFAGMLAVGLLTAGCRGYNLGNQYLYRSDIRTVHVPIFESTSFRRFLGQRLTESVIKQIELNSPYTIANPEIADSFVRGRLVRERKRSSAEDFFDNPRVVQIDYRVEVTWVDRAGTPLMPVMSLRIDRDVDFIPEGGQSMTTAQQEIIDRIAREIVGQMEMPW